MVGPEVQHFQPGPHPPYLHPPHSQAGPIPQLPTHLGGRRPRGQLGVRQLGPVHGLQRFTAREHQRAARVVAALQRGDQLVDRQHAPAQRQPRPPCQAGGRPELRGACRCRTTPLIRSARRHSILNRWRSAQLWTRDADAVPSADHIHSDAPNSPKRCSHDSLREWGARLCRRLSCRPRRSPRRRRRRRRRSSAAAAPQ